jgi:bifunctional non-homologous end joining protein LigD
MSRLRAGRPIGFIIPYQPTTAHKPPSGAGWIHEIKHDGYRMKARRDGTGIRLLTRNNVCRPLWRRSICSISSRA